MEQILKSSKKLQQEKTNLKNDILALINDKRSYSAWRILELMCKGSRYAIHELGTCEDVDKITSVSLYEHYRKILTTSPVDIFIFSLLFPSCTY